MSNAFGGDFTAHNQLNGAQINANTVNFGSSTETAKDKKTKLLESLKFKHIDSRWSSIKQEHVQTCAWLLEEPEFQGWLAHHNAQENHGLLWIKGHPGCGKSTLMKYAFSACRKKTKGTTFASFFFNARGDILEKSTPGMYRSLLYQLLGRQSLEFISNVLDDVMLDDYHSETFLWTNESLESLFRAVIKELKRPVTCFIDALDECDENQVRHMVLSFDQLGQIALQHQIRFQVCFSSRHYPNISIRRAQGLILDGRTGHHQDITHYIEDVLDIGSGELADEVRAEVQRKSGGIFMWVVLVVDLLNIEYDQGQMKALRQRLDDIPEKLSTLFQQILTRHCHNREQVLLCLQWLLFAKEPLKPGQLYCAVLVETDQDIAALGRQSTDLDVIKKFVLSSSKGLAEIVQSESSSIVQFIHESVRDFLLKENGLQEIWLGLTIEYTGQSHERLKKCCTLYLDAFKVSVLGYDFVPEAGDNPSLPEDRKFELVTHPFLQYAVDNVLYHADEAACNQISQEAFLRQFDRSTWITLHNTFQQKKTRRFIGTARLLYILAQINASFLIGYHPEKRSYLEVGREPFGTPLYVALATYNRETIRCFLELHVEGLPAEHPAQSYLQRCHPTGGHMTRSRWTKTRSTKTRWITSDKSKTNILIQVLEFCDDTAGLIFLHTAKPEAIHPLKNYRNSTGRSLLAVAAIEDCYEIVKFLLEQVQIDPNIQEVNGTSALHHAAQAGLSRIVRLLLTNETTNVNLQDKLGRTPLVAAVKRHYPPLGKRFEVVKVMLEFSSFQVESTVNSASTRDFDSLTHNVTDTPESPPELMRLDLNVKDCQGRSALSHAAELCPANVVEMLLEKHQIDVNSRCEFGMTPLSYAVLFRNLEATAVLLKTNQVDIDSRNNKGRSPLSYAAEFGQLEAIDMLLKTSKVDIDSRDNRGKSPLYYAAGAGRQEAVDMLLKTNMIDNNSRDNDGSIPLPHAAGAGRRDGV